LKLLGSENEHERISLQKYYRRFKIKRVRNWLSSKFQIYITFLHVELLKWTFFERLHFGP